MNITDSKIRFMKDGNIYTLLQKDENSKIKFRDGDGVINIATKQEVIENLPYITYHDTVKIYYYLNIRPLTNLPAVLPISGTVGNSLMLLSLSTLVNI